MRIQKIFQNKLFKGLLSLGLLTSIFFNIFLLKETFELNQFIKVKESDTLETKDEVNTGHKELIQYLEKENKKLKNQLLEDDTVKLDSQVKENNNKKEMLTFVEGFINKFFNRNKELDVDRREHLKEYLVQELLDTFAPKGEDATPDFELTHGTLENTLGEEYVYEVKVIDQEIYTSSNKDKDIINILAYVDLETKLNEGSSTNEKMLLDLRIRENKKGYEVNNMYFKFIEDMEV